MTKKAKALELYRNNHNLPRKDLIQLVQNELNTTENSARTHISMAAKELNPTLGKDYVTRTTDKSMTKRVRAEMFVRDNFHSMPRKTLTEQLMKDLDIKTIQSARTHVSQAVRQLGL